MVIVVKNKNLRKRINKKMDKLEKESLYWLKKGDTKKAKKLEAESDKLYKKNYDKMYSVVVNGKKLKSYKSKC